jgi:hypothetical protein
MSGAVPQIRRPGASFLAENRGFYANSLSIIRIVLPSEKEAFRLEHLLPTENAQPH